MTEHNYIKELEEKLILEKERADRNYKAAIFFEERYNELYEILKSESNAVEP